MSDFNNPKTPYTSGFLAFLSNSSPLDLGPVTCSQTELVITWWRVRPSPAWFPDSSQRPREAGLRLQTVLSAPARTGCLPVQTLLCPSITTGIPTLRSHTSELSWLPDTQMIAVVRYQYLMIPLRWGGVVKAAGLIHTPSPQGQPLCWLLGPQVICPSLSSV